MPTITIKRGGGWTDCLRAYAVHIDGKERGAIRAKGVERFEVTAGRHTIQLWIGPIYRSSIVAVDVGDGDVVLTCGVNTLPGLAMLSLASADHRIALEIASPDGAEIVS